MCDISNLIGLSATVPKCFEGDAPDGYDTAETGYYVADKDYGVRLLDDCKWSGWEVLEAAKAAAVRDFKTDLGALILQNTDKAFTPFTGLIGQTNHSGADISFVRPVGGVQLSCGGAAWDLELVISAVYLGLNTSGSYTLRVSSNDPEFTSATKTVAAVSGKFNKNALAAGNEIVLPLYSKHFEGQNDIDLEYYLTIEFGGAKPLLSKFGCCGYVPGWKHFLEAEGLAASDTGLSSPATKSATNGVVLDAYLRCNTLDFICRLDQVGGYDLKSVIGRTLQFRAGATAYGLMVDGGLLNICTLYNREEIDTHRNFLNQKYAEYLQYVVDNLPSGVSQCFTCKDSAYFHKANNLL